MICGWLFASCLWLVAWRLHSTAGCLKVAGCWSHAFYWQCSARGRRLCGPSCRCAIQRCVVQNIAAFAVHSNIWAALLGSQRPSWFALSRRCSLGVWTLACLHDMWLVVCMLAVAGWSALAFHSWLLARCLKHVARVPVPVFRQGGCLCGTCCHRAGRWCVWICGCVR